MSNELGVRHAAAIVLAAAAVSCASPAASTSSAGARQSVSPPATTASPSGGTSGGVSDLSAELLTTADMPAGWSRDPATGSSAADRGCLRVTGAVTPQRQAQARFTAGASGMPLFAESLGWFQPDAHAAFSSAQQALTRCRTVSFSAGGMSFQGTVTALPFPSFADESTAFEVSVSTTDSGTTATLGLELVLIRKGGTLISTELIDAGAPDAITLSELTARAVAKVR